ALKGDGCIASAEVGAQGRAVGSTASAPYAASYALVLQGLQEVEPILACFTVEHKLGTALGSAPVVRVQVDCVLRCHLLLQDPAVESEVHAASDDLAAGVLLGQLAGCGDYLVVGLRWVIGIKSH